MRRKLEEKADAIIREMTLDEKFAQLMNETPGIPRLGIEPYDWWNEGLHGVGRAGRATVFPEPIALAATFHPQMMQQIGDAIASEARAKYQTARRNGNHARYTGLTFWSPNVNIFRDPRWGRGMETWGEDPLLTGTMASAFVRGMQGEDPDYLKVAACGKHFAVHSGPEATRHSANVEPSLRDLYETYLPAFRMLVQQARVEIIMGAYNRVYREAASGSKFLLTDVLRRQWGFRGHIVSDCDAVTDIWKGHHLADSEAEACAIAIKAGLNVECGSSFKALREALDRQLIAEEDINRALKPLVMTRLKLGILGYDPDCPYNHTDPSVVGSPGHVALARQAATESMVLLKNEPCPDGKDKPCPGKDGSCPDGKDGSLRPILPLSKTLSTLFVTGAGAADAFWLMGNYFGISDRYSTYLQGIVSKVSDGTAVNYRPGVLENAPTMNSINWAVDEAAAAERTIVVMGLNGNLEGEEGEAIDSEHGDKKDLRIPESQMNYLRQICQRRGRRRGVVVVLTGGSPMDLREVTQLADAVVMAWYPGQEGGYALGDLLFGDADFSGRLPVTFPADGDLLPPFDDYSMQGRTYKYMSDNIFYPFGYGLSYSHVGYSRLRTSIHPGSDDAGASIHPGSDDAAACLHPGSDDAGASLSATVTLTNNGCRPATATPQLYATAPGAGQSAPLQQLVAFQQVRLQPGECRDVTFTVPMSRLATVQADGSSQLTRGTYVISVSSAAPSPRSRQLGVQTLVREVSL